MAERFHWHFTNVFNYYWLVKCFDWSLLKLDSDLAKTVFPPFPPPRCPRQGAVRDQLLTKDCSLGAQHGNTASWAEPSLAGAQAPTMSQGQPWGGQPASAESPPCWAGPCWSDRSEAEAGESGSVPGSGTPRWVLSWSLVTGQLWGEARMSGWSSGAGSGRPLARWGHGWDAAAAWYRWGPGQEPQPKSGSEGKGSPWGGFFTTAFFKCVPTNAGLAPRQPDSRGLGECTQGTGAASLCSKMSALSSSMLQHLVHLQLSLSSCEWPRSSPRSGT